MSRRPSKSAGGSHAVRSKSRRAPSRLTHVNSRGQARMVDVGAKAATQRIAVASAVVDVGAAALRLITGGRIPKGDVLAVARIAGIAAAKRTSDLIPLCHPLALESVEVDVVPRRPASVRVTATARITGKTGVEMEALTAVAVAALTIYDMCKSVTNDIRIGPIQLESKLGGKSGAYRRGVAGVPSGSVAAAPSLPAVAGGRRFRPKAEQNPRMARGIVKPLRPKPDRGI